jgi:hypothetical protein
MAMRRTRNTGFVTSELFIVLGCIAVAIVGGVILARSLHFGWVASAALAVGAVVLIVLALSFIFSPRKR